MVTNISVTGRRTSEKERALFMYWMSLANLKKAIPENGETIREVEMASSSFETMTDMKVVGIMIN